MNKYLLALILLAGCRAKSKDTYKHTDYLHMRTMPGNDTLGCKDGRIWRQVGDNDFVDIGPVTDSCNCNRKGDNSFVNLFRGIPLLKNYSIEQIGENPDSMQVMINKFMASGKGETIFLGYEHPFLFVKKEGWKYWDTLKIVVFICNSKDTVIEYATTNHPFDASHYGSFRIPARHNKLIDTAYVSDLLK